MEVLLYTVRVDALWKDDSLDKERECQKRSPMVLCHERDTYPTLNMPRNVYLSGSEPKLCGNIFYHGNVEGFLDTLSTTKRRVRFEENVVVFRPLVKVSEKKRESPTDMPDTHLQKVRLRVPVI